MSEAMAPVPEDSPLWRAWVAYRDSDAAANATRWAVLPDHTQGSLWAAFERGFAAAQAPDAQPEPATTDEALAAHLDEIADETPSGDFREIFRDAAQRLRELANSQPVMNRAEIDNSASDEALREAVRDLYCARDTQARMDARQRAWDAIDTLAAEKKAAEDALAALVPVDAVKYVFVGGVGPHMPTIRAARARQGIADA